MRRLISILLALCASGAAAGQAAPAGSPGALAERIAAAQPGDTLGIAPGVYRGPIRIDKPLTLVAEPGAILDGGGGGDIVEITAPDVTLQGFIIRGTGDNLELENVAVRVTAPRATIVGNTLRDTLFGIDLKQAPDSVIRGNIVGGKDLDIARRGDSIRLWRSDRCLVEGNTLHDGRDAILWYSNGVTVRNNRALRCRYGFHLMYSNDVRLEGNELSGNSVGVYFMYSRGLTLTGNRLIKNRGPSGYGLGLKDTDDFRVEGNVFAGNRVGVYLDDSPFTTGSPGSFTGNTFAYNDIGMTLLPAVKGNVIVSNNFIDNAEQLSISGRGELTGNEFARGNRGNFWSDYVGYDADGNGVGDYEHESQRLFEGLVDREPKLRLLMYSPAHQAIEFIGRALPAVQPEPKFTDPWPLMRPVETGAAPAPANGGGLAIATAGLVGIAVAVGALGGAIDGRWFTVLRRPRLVPATPKGGSS